YGAANHRRKEIQRKLASWAVKDGLYGTSLLKQGQSAYRERQEGFAEPGGKPQISRLQLAGKTGSEESADSHQHTAPTGHRRERARPFHGFANVSDIIDRAVVDRNDLQVW